MTFRMYCKCPCHYDVNNVFSYTRGIHCDKCYDKRVKKEDNKK